MKFGSIKPGLLLVGGGFRLTREYKNSGPFSFVLDLKEFEEFQQGQER